MTHVSINLTMYYILIAMYLMLGPVSYTHLDVYKRQFIVIPKLRWASFSISTMVLSTVSFATEAPSNSIPVAIKFSSIMQ